MFGIYYGAVYFVAFSAGDILDIFHASLFTATKWSNAHSTWIYGLAIDRKWRKYTKYLFLTAATKGIRLHYPPRWT